MALTGGHTNRGELRIHESLDELRTDLADYIAELSDASVKERGFFAIVLSGGSLIGLMGKLFEAPYIKTVDWSKWYIFWADERVVAKNHADSNYKLAKDGFLSKVIEFGEIHNSLNLRYVRSRVLILIRIDLDKESLLISMRLLPNLTGLGPHKPVDLYRVSCTPGCMNNFPIIWFQKFYCCGCLADDRRAMGSG